MGESKNNLTISIYMQGGKGYKKGNRSTDNNKIPDKLAYRADKVGAFWWFITWLY